MTTFTIEVPDALAAEITTIARAAQTTPEAFILLQIKEAVEPKWPFPPETEEEFIAALRESLQESKEGKVTLFSDWFAESWKPYPPSA